MASITLKNIPEALHCHYKWRAKTHARSLQAEILHTLARSASATEEADHLALDDVAGMLKPRRNGVTVEEMNKGIDPWLRDSWK